MPLVVLPEAMDVHDLAIRTKSDPHAAQAGTVSGGRPPRAHVPSVQAGYDNIVLSWSATMPAMPLASPMRAVQITRFGGPSTD